MLVFLAMVAAEALPGSARPGMAEQVRALSLDATQAGEVVEVVLRGQARQPVEVRYSIELSGGSTTRHSGQTRIAANVPVVLSRMRMTIGTGWCARAHVQQGDGIEYTIREGNCP